MVPAREPNRNGWEDEVEVATVLDVSRAEEGGPKPSVIEKFLRNRVCDCALPRSSQPAQPVDGGLVEVPCPELDPVQDGFAGSLQAAFSVDVLVFSRMSDGEIINDIPFSW